TVWVEPLPQLMEKVKPAAWSPAVGATVAAHRAVVQRDVAVQGPDAAAVAAGGVVPDGTVGQRDVAVQRPDTGAARARVPRHRAVVKRDVGVRRIDARTGD